MKVISIGLGLSLVVLAIGVISLAAFGPSPALEVVAGGGLVATFIFLPARAYGDVVQGRRNQRVSRTLTDR